MKEVKPVTIANVVLCAEHRHQSLKDRPSTSSNLPLLSMHCIHLSVLAVNLEVRSKLIHPIERCTDTLKFFEAKGGSQTFDFPNVILIYP